MKSPRIVVLGAGGMLGHKLFQRLRTEFPGTIGTIRKTVSEAPFDRIDLFQGADVIGGVDAGDFENLRTMLSEMAPDFIVNCVGVIKQRDEATSAIPSITLNALLPHRLAAMAAEWGGRLIHFSTDCIFDGQHGGYSEEDESNATDLYGKSKFLGEVATDNALTLRTSIIGRELAHHKSLLDWFLSQNHKAVNGFTRFLFSGVTTIQMSELIVEIIRKGSLTGLFHVVSAPISKYELLCLIRDEYKLDIEIRPDANFVCDRSMKGDKLFGAIGYVSPSWESQIATLAADPTPYDQWIMDEQNI